MSEIQTVSYTTMMNIIAEVPEPKMTPRDRWKLQHRLARIWRRRIDEMVLDVMLGGKRMPPDCFLRLPERYTGSPFKLVVTS